MTAAETILVALVVAVVLVPIITAIVLSVWDEDGYATGVVLGVELMVLVPSTVLAFIVVLAQLIRSRPR